MHTMLATDRRPIHRGRRAWVPALLVAALAAASLGAVQITRTEVVKPTTPADDSKPNSDKVPEVYGQAVRFERTLVFRFKHQADLLAGLERMVKDHRIRNAVILSGIGSVGSYHYHTVSNRTFPSKNVFVRNPAGPADISSVNGYVIDGRVHAHVVFADPDRAFGGHLEPGTTVFTFAIVTVGVVTDGADFTRLDDKTWR
jgi:predicted DNA-binding protein with PD1-like motif